MIGTIPARRAALPLALGLVLAGGILRFHQAWSHRAVYLPDVAQEEGYYEMGVGLLSYLSFGKGVPNDAPGAWRGPVYPVFIALIESFSPEPDPGKVRLAQAALATFSILLVFVLGSRLHSSSAGLLAAAFLALSAEQAFAVTSLNIHGFYSFLLLATCGALVLWLERPSPGSTVMAGAFLGFTLLCRSSHFLLVPLLAAAAWRWRPLPGPRWRAPALLILGAALALAPMAARNRAVTGRWLLFPDAYAGAVALFGATTGLQGLGSYTVEQARALAEVVEPGFAWPADPDFDIHPVLLDLAGRRIVRDPAHFAGLCLRRLALLASALWLPLLLGAAGLALRRHDRRLQVPMLVAASFSGYCVAGGAPEHQAAVMPVLFLCAGNGAAVLLDRVLGAAPRPLPATRGWMRTVLASGPALGLLLGAAMLIALAVEAGSRIRPAAPPPPSRDGRALSVLRRAADRPGARARPAYIEALAQAGIRRGAAGDCAGAEMSLRRSLLLDPRQPKASGAFAACLAFRGDAARADALADGIRARDKSERADFWDAALRQSDASGDGAASWLLSRARTLPAEQRDGIVGLWLRRAERAARTGAREEALRSLSRLEAAAPLSAVSRENVAALYRRLHAPHRAAALLEARPSPGSLIDLAELRARAGRRGAAVDALRKAESLGGFSADQRRRVVGLYRRLEEPRRAAAALELLLRDAPREAGLWIELAELRAKSGARDAALKALARIEPLAANDGQRRLAVGLYRELGDRRRAAALLEPLLLRAPRDAGLWLERAELELQAGARDSARGSLARAEALIDEASDREGELARRLALAHQSLGQHPRAVEILAGLTRRFPGDGTLYADKGLCEYLGGAPGAAIASLETAIRLRPKFLPAYLTLGAIHAAQKRPEEALKVYDEGLTRSPAADGDPLRAILLEERRAAAEKARRL